MGAIKKRGAGSAAFWSMVFLTCCLLILFASDQISRSLPLTYVLLGATAVAGLLAPVFIVRLVSGYVRSPFIRVISRRKEPK